MSYTRSICRIAGESLSSRAKIERGSKACLVRKALVTGDSDVEVRNLLRQPRSGARVIRPVREKVLDHDSLTGLAAYIDDEGSKDQEVVKHSRAMPAGMSAGISAGDPDLEDLSLDDMFGLDRVFRTSHVCAQNVLRVRNP